MFLITSCYAANENIKAEAVIAWPRGGGTDTLFRLLISHVNSNNKDINILPTNKIGFAGALALNYVYIHPADATRILINAENPPLYEFLGYGDKNYDDFECILLAATEAVGLIVPAESKWHTYSEIVYDSKNVREITQAITNVGSLPWSSSAMLSSFAQGDFKQEWYDTDVAAMMAVFNGEADFTFIKVQMARQAVKNGRLRFICTLTDKRLPEWEDVPAVTEEFPEFKNYLPWGPFYGAFVKKGTDPKIIERLKNAFMDAYNSKACQKYLADGKMIPLGLSGQEANDYIHKWQERTLTAFSKGKLNLDFKFNNFGNQ